MKLMHRNNRCRFCRNCVGEISVWLGFERRLSQYISKGKKTDYDFECAGHERVKLWESFMHPCDHPDLGPKYGGGKASCFVRSCPRARRWNSKGIGMALALAAFSKLEEQSTAEPCVLGEGFHFLCLWFCFLNTNKLLQLFWIFPPGL